MHAATITWYLRYSSFDCEHEWRMHKHANLSIWIIRRWKKQRNKVSSSHFLYSFYRNVATQFSIGVGRFFEHQNLIFALLFFFLSVLFLTFFTLEFHSMQSKNSLFNTRHIDSMIDNCFRSKTVDANELFRNLHLITAVQLKFKYVSLKTRLMTISRSNR